MVAIARQRRAYLRFTTRDFTTSIFPTVRDFKQGVRVSYWRANVVKQLVERRHKRPPVASAATAVAPVVKAGQ